MAKLSTIKNVQAGVILSLPWRQHWKTFAGFRPLFIRHLRLYRGQLSKMSEPQMFHIEYCFKTGSMYPPVIEYLYPSCHWNASSKRCCPLGLSRDGSSWREQGLTRQATLPLPLLETRIVWNLSLGTGYLLSIFQTCAEYWTTKWQQRKIWHEINIWIWYFFLFKFLSIINYHW